MKLFGLCVLRTFGDGRDPVICSSAIDVSTFGFFQRNSAREFLVFMSRTLAKRVGPNTKTQVTQDAHVISAVSSNDGICCVCVTDSEYNTRVAFTMLSQLLLDFLNQFRGKYERVVDVKDNFLPWTHIEATLTKDQNPEEADKILKLKRDIEETKIVMYDAIDKVLERGEKIDALVAKSNDLGAASKTFYTQAKKTNSSCCSVM
jgi:synaptobrevin family protein YKT6